MRPKTVTQKKCSWTFFHLSLAHSFIMVNKMWTTQNIKSYIAKPVHVIIFFFGMEYMRKIFRIKMDMIWRRLKSVNNIDDSLLWRFESQSQNTINVLGNLIFWNDLSSIWKIKICIFLFSTENIRFHVKCGSYRLCPSLVCICFQYRLMLSWYCVNMTSFTV